MERVRENIAVGRAHTDKSLGDERAKVDSTADVGNLAARRMLDDVIEQDRILADRKLWKFRDRADGMLADNRLRWPDGASSVAIERQIADDGRTAERMATDAFVDGERQRTDAATEAGRQEHEADRTGMEARRQHTDDHLLLERYDADAAVNALDEAKAALAHAYGGPSPRGDVLAMVSHDLRSPLAIITLNAQTIAELVTSHEALEAVHEVRHAAARMERMLTDLLDVARIDSGTLRVVKGSYDIGLFLVEVRRSYRPLFEDRGIAFAVHMPPETFFASFDHDRIVQVLSNLLGNALKFTPVGGAVTMNVEHRADGIEFVLHNSGPGIRSADKPNLFRRFWQIDARERRGLCLGLHICEKIVVAHGGRIWAESEPGEGATFRFTLPAARV
jgi:signal transduction histidine kinase